MRLQIYGDEIYITAENSQDVCFLDRFDKRAREEPVHNLMRMQYYVQDISNDAVLRDTLNGRPTSIVLGYQDSARKKDVESKPKGREFI